VKVNVAGVECNALNDSGCQIPVVSTRLFDWCGENAIGSAVLSKFSACQRADALLVSLDVCLSGDSNICNIMEKMPLVCAIADLGSQDYDVILPTDVVAEVKNLPVISVAGPVINDVMVTYDDTKVCNVSECCDIVSHGVNDVKQANIMYDDVDSVLLSDNVNVVEVSDDVTLTSESHSELSNEQMADTTLATCWKMAKKGKGGFLILNDVLYHKDNVEGRLVSQLCLPQSRRVKVLQLAHDSVFCGYMGEKKTRERIRLSFYWPGLRQSVHD